MNGHIFDASVDALFLSLIFFFFKGYNNGNMNICKSQDLLQAYSHCPTDKKLVINTESLPQSKHNKQLFFSLVGWVV